MPLPMRHLATLLLASLIGTDAFAADAAGSDSCAVPARLAVARPDPEGTPTRVEVGVYVIDLMKIDDAEQSFTVDFYFIVRWRDARLAAEARGGSLTGCKLKRAELWHPRVEVINQRGLTEYLDNAAIVDDAGWVEYRQRYYGELQAPFDVREFPFDSQDLPITVAAFGYSPEEVSFAVDKRTGLRPELSVAGWSIELGDPRIGSEHVPALDRRISRFDFVMHARRHSGFYAWKMLVPLSLIVFMAWTVFWIDPQHVAPQVGISTASVFTLIAFNFSLGRLLPRVSYLTRADTFVMGSMVLVFLALGEAVVTSRISGSGREDLARRIDRWARVIYAVLFAVLFALTVWNR